MKEVVREPSRDGPDMALIVADALRAAGGLHNPDDAETLACEVLKAMGGPTGGIATLSPEAEATFWTAFEAAHEHHGRYESTVAGFRAMLAKVLEDFKPAPTVTLRFQRRADGGLRAWSTEVPLILSHRDATLVMTDLAALLSNPASSFYQDMTQDGSSPPSPGVPHVQE